LTIKPGNRLGVPRSAWTVHPGQDGVKHSTSI
jgi:hypothetical protein